MDVVKAGAMLAVVSSPIGRSNKSWQNTLFLLHMSAGVDPREVQDHVKYSPLGWLKVIPA